MMLAEWNSDVLCLCETWLSDKKIPNNALHIPNYTHFRRERTDITKGGLLIFVANHFTCLRRFDLEDDDIECIFLELTVPNVNIYFFSVTVRLDSPQISSSMLCLVGSRQRMLSLL